MNINYERQLALKMVAYFESIADDYKGYKKRSAKAMDKARWDAKIEELGFVVEIIKTVYVLWDDGVKNVIPSDSNF